MTIQSEITAVLGSIKVIEDRQIQHRADTKGVVITRVLTQEFVLDGERQVSVAHFWHNWETGAFSHVS